MVTDLQKIIKENKKLKEKKSKGFKLTDKIVVKDILKKEKITVNIPNRKVENVFEDENRFFKGNFEKEKRSMFLS